MEFVSLGDVVRFGVVTHNSSGVIYNADAVPRWSAYINNSDTAVISADFVLRTGLIGTYRGSGIFNTGNGFARGDYVEIIASGLVNGIQGRDVVKTFVINDVFDSNIVQVSGTNINYTDIVPPAVYFAGIKYIRDDNTSKDEYTVQWFKNSIPLPSGSVTNAAISVYDTQFNTSLFTNKVLNYYNLSHGGLRYNEQATIQTSGEPYMAVTSGTIDSATRVWNNVVGIDFMR